MPELTTNDATPLTTFGASKTSKVFYCGGGIMNVYLSGDASTNTLTLKACRTATGTFDTYVVDDSTGTPANQTFTVTNVPALSTYHRCYLEHGMYFQFSTNASGTPAWEIDVNGTFVHIIE